MKNQVLAGLLVMATSTSVLAAEAVTHFEGLPSDTLEQAISHFTQGNEALEQILSQPLSPERMVEIHALTYTLENALERLQIELDALAETLEAVHVGSEALDTDAVQTHGAAYLAVGHALKALGE